MKEMTESQQLLAEYAEHGSEAAFRELVARYVNLVHSTALRLMDGNAQSAEDVTQTIFVHLSRNARKLSREPFIGGWLHRDTCYEAAKTLRRERRRRAREAQAALMNSLTDHSKANLDAVAPVLDEAINLLGAEDRAAILLRFFEQRDFRSVGAALGSNEDAARMRVNRALGKLHAWLQRRGVTLSAAALATALAGGAVSAAPVGLANSVAGSVLTGSATCSGVTATLLKIMTITKLKAGIAGAIAAACVATSLVIQNHANARQREQATSLRQQAGELEQLTAENARLSSLLTQTKAEDAGDELNELGKLRAEAETLRQQTAGLVAIREENRKLKAKIGKTAGKTQTPLQMKEEALDRMNFSRGWQIAFLTYAEEHNGNYPTSFDQALSGISNARTESENVTSNLFEIVYQGSQKDITNSANTIVLREKEARQGLNGRWNKTYGFADGHAEVHSEPEGNFEAYERKRIITHSPQ